MAVLLLSFGVLALGTMMAFVVQMPKVSGYRIVAVNLASSHIDRIRANPGEFAFYAQPLHKDLWSASEISAGSCAYPNCYVAGQHNLALKDDLDTRRAARGQLPAGDMLLNCDTAVCTTGSQGNLWIVWQEPTSNAVFNASTSDNCPTEVGSTYPSLNTRCLYVRFAI